MDTNPPLALPLPQDLVVLLGARGVYEVLAWTAQRRIGFPVYDSPPLPL